MLISPAKEGSFQRTLLSGGIGQFQRNNDAGMVFLDILIDIGRKESCVRPIKSPLHQQIRFVRVSNMQIPVK